MQVVSDAFAVSNAVGHISSLSLYLLSYRGFSLMSRGYMGKFETLKKLMFIEYLDKDLFQKEKGETKQ